MRRRGKKGGLGGLIGFLIVLGFITDHLGGLILGGGAIAAIVLVLKKLNDSLDLTTHNRQDLKPGEQPRPSTVQRPVSAPVQQPQAAPAQPVQKAPVYTAQPTAAGRTARPAPLEIDSVKLSGDAQADAVIEKGREMIHKIREENMAIPDAKLSYQMDQLERICTQIFRTVSEQPTKAPQIRKFMNYYLPTTLKMLSSYHTMQDRGVSYGDMQEAQATLTRGLDMVLTACQKQLDNLYKDTMMDVSTDIDVLEKMLERDGFRDGELMDSLKNGSAAASQMASGAPVLQVPDSDAYFDTDHSKYHKAN